MKRLGLGLAALAMLLSGPLTSQSAQAAAVVVPNCRYGITITGDAGRFDFASLGVGGYLDWRQTSPIQPPADVDYVHVVRLRLAKQFLYGELPIDQLQQFEDALKSAVASAPGQAWLIGNEPDTAFETQDSLTPDRYALAYHNLYRLIKAADPIAQVGVGTIVQPTPLRLQWLDAFWTAYADRYQTQPPSDFWSIHSFILREKKDDWGTGIPPGLNAVSGELYELDQTDNIQIFSQRLVAFRQWLASHGQRQKPLWITEYGSLLPSDGRNGLVTQPPERARDYMLNTFQFLSSATDAQTGYPYDGNHLVQRWFWYSLDDALWRFGGSLFDPETNNRTLIGDAFAAYVRASDPQPALQIAGGGLVTWPKHQGQSALARVIVANAGSATAHAPLTVTWFEGDPAQGGQPVATSNWAGPLAGCGATVTLLARVPYPTNFDAPIYVRLESTDLAQPIIQAFSLWSRAVPPP